MIRKLTLEETRKYISDDPVRPHLSAEFRTQENREVWALFEDQYAVADEPMQDPLAVTCVAYAHGWPEDEAELDRFSLTTNTATIPSEHVDPEIYNPSRFDSLQAALDFARELQGELEVCENGTILNRFGETMVYDSEGNLSPDSRTFQLQLEQNTMVFYTIWSYSRGAGRQLLNQVAEHARDTRDDIWHWVTLSPLTDIAERFHLKNGATKHAVFKHNQIFSYKDVIMPPDRLEQRMQKIRLSEPDTAEQARSALR
jgi:hypothetical protein